jgi:hypothetical protein
MDSLTDEVVPKAKKPRAKRKVKEVSELDESIMREFKKNRIGSKITKSDSLINDDSDKLIYIIEKINELINSATKEEKKYIYILDQLYPDSDICFLTGPVDSYTIVVNNSIVYKDLKMQHYDLIEHSKIYFYDGVNGLTEQA